MILCIHLFQHQLCFLRYINFGSKRIALVIFLCQILCLFHLPFQALALLLFSRLKIYLMDFLLLQPICPYCLSGHLCFVAVFCHVVLGLNSPFSIN